MRSNEKKRMLILYSSIDGQTKKIADFIKELLKEDLFEVDLFSINEAVSFENYDLLVIGASIRYGKHNAKVLNFVNSNIDKLKQMKTAFFSVNLVARKANKQSKEDNPYVKKFFDNVSWNPQSVAVFAGALDYSRYGFLDALMIKLIMKFTKGPTRSDEPIEYTDWEKVKTFAKAIRTLVN